VKISKVVLSRFRNTVLGYYRKNARVMPWRETQDPYHIFVSEVMLQQTQVSRVISKFPLFISRFPNFRALGSSKTNELLAIWSGMGYNRRALYLREAAFRITEEHGGVLPRDPEILDSFPGIGPATASSIICYAYNVPAVFIETNIRRVFIHHFFTDRQEVHDREIYPLVAATLDRLDPRIWYYALMDYGTHLAKTVPNPNRKSRHYAVQSRFEGSDRQIRGMILRLLLKRGMTREELIKHLAEPEERVRRILNDLSKDGFVIVKDNTYEIQ
jgi:A/G-specific adenine glycosylase